MSPIDPPPSPSRGSPRALRAAAALAGLAALAACVAPKVVPPPPPPAPPPVVVVPVVKCDPPREPEDLAARHLLATQEHLAALNTADLTQEANRPADPLQPETTMDQALALSMTRTPGDLARAQALLDQVLHNNASQADPWRGLARLVNYRIGEQRRAEEQADRNAQQLRDAQRDAQRKLDQLNDKLEALKAIERSLNNARGNPPAPAASK